MLSPLSMGLKVKSIASLFLRYGLTPSSGLTPDSERLLLPAGVKHQYVRQGRRGYGVNSKRGCGIGRLKHWDKEPITDKNDPTVPELMAKEFNHYQTHFAEGAAT